MIFEMNKYNTSFNAVENDMNTSIQYYIML